MRKNISILQMGHIFLLSIIFDQFYYLVPSNQEFHLISSEILCNNIFLLDSKFKDLIREKEILPCLLYQVSSCKDVDFCVKVLQLVVNVLAKNKSSQDEFRELNGLSILNEMLKNNESEQVRSGSATALWAATIYNGDSIATLTDENMNFINPNLLLTTQPILVGLVATLSNIANFSGLYLTFYFVIFFIDFFGLLLETGQNLIRQQNMIPHIIDNLRGSYAPLLEATAGAIMALCKENGTIFLFPSILFQNFKQVMNYH